MTKHSVITIPAHGKSTADGMASEASAKVAEGCQFGYHLAPGTRQHVLYLAQMHPAPKAYSKKGLWSPKRYFCFFFTRNYSSRLTTSSHTRTVSSFATV